MISDRKLPDFWHSPVSNLPDVPDMTSDNLKAVFDSNSNEIKPNFNGLIDDLSGAGGASNICASELYADDPSEANVQAKLEAVYNIAKDAVAGGIPDRSLSGMKLEAGAVSKNELSQEVTQFFVKKEGDTMTGELVLADYPQNDMGAVPKSMLQNFSRIKNRISTTYNQTIAAGGSVTKKIPHGGSFVTVTNSVTNPSFEDTAFWVTNTGIAYSTSYAYNGSRSLKVTSASANNVTDNIINVTQGHIYYIANHCKVVSNPNANTLTGEIRGWGTLTYFGDVVKRTAGAEDWTRYSTRFLYDQPNNQITFRLGCWAASGLEAYFDGVMVIDLTAAFGAGKEPDKAWCDANIQYYAGSYDVIVTPSSTAYPDKSKLFFKSGTAYAKCASVSINRDVNGNYFYSADGTVYSNIGGNTGYGGMSWRQNAAGKIFFSEGSGTNLAQFGNGAIETTGSLEMSVTVDDLYIYLNILNTDGANSKTLNTTMTAEVY